MSIPRDRRDEKNQVVTDAQGRRRFHGAFTGGFSAGYYNTVGSEEGWTPSEYKSSNSRRQRKCDFSLFVVRFPIFLKPQTYPRSGPEDFMDEEDDPLMGRRMVTQEGYSRGPRAANDTNIPSDLLTKKHDQIGKKLLMQLGWRPGHGVGPRTRRSKNLYKETNHLFAPKDVNIFIVAPKNDVYGVGFSEKNRLGSSSSFSKRSRKNDGRLVISSSGRIGAAHRSGFGLGAFEAPDSHMTDVYGDDDDMSNYSRAIDTVPFDHDRGDLSSSRLLLESEPLPQERTSDGKPVPKGWKLQRQRHDSFRKTFPNLQVPRDFDGYHRPSSSKRQHTTVNNRNVSLREKQAHRANLLRGDDSSSNVEALNDPKNLVASLIQKQKRAAEMVSSKPPALLSGIDTSAKKKQNEYETAKADANTALYQQRMSDERRKIAEKLSSRFRSTNSSSSSSSSSSNVTIKKDLRDKQREPRTTHIWQPDRLLCKRFGLPVPKVVHDNTSNSSSRSKEESSMVSIPPVNSNNVESQSFSMSIIHVPKLDKPVLSDRPGMDFFKSIFEASSSEEEEEEEEEEEKESVVAEKVVQSVVVKDDNTEMRRRPMVCPDSNGVRFKSSVRSSSVSLNSEMNKTLSTGDLPPWALAAKVALLPQTPRIRMMITTVVRRRRRRGGVRRKKRRRKRRSENLRLIVLPFPHKTIHNELTTMSTIIVLIKEYESVLLFIREK